MLTKEEITILAGGRQIMVCEHSPSKRIVYVEHPHKDKRVAVMVADDDTMDTLKSVFNVAIDQLEEMAYPERRDRLMAAYKAALS